METRLELSERAVPASVRPIRHRVVQAARDAGAVGSVADEIGLCVGEAVANAVRHAYASDVGTIAVLVQADEVNFLVTVRDRGAGLDQPVESPSPPDDREPGEDGGFGLRIIEALARDVSIWSAPGHGTVLRMRFSLEAPRPRRGAPAERHAPG